jgi:ketosteroid isomerase-like protein
MNKILRLAISAASLLLLTLPGTARAADLQAELKGLADNERAFAQMAKDKTVREAFVHFIADDGLIFGPEGPTNGKAFFKAAPPPPPGAPKLELLWWPVHADIARSADLGWTTGPSKRSRGDKVSYGYFLTVWKKQPDGQWRFLVDNGIDTDEMSAQGSDTPIAPLRVEKAKAEFKPMDPKTSLEGLLTVDRELSKVTSHGDKAGWLAAMADDARLMRNGPQPSVGKEAVRAALEKEPGAITTEPLGGEVSAAGDLGYTYGKGSWKKGDAAEPVLYLRIWEKRDGAWKLVVDQMASAS